MKEKYFVVDPQDYQVHVFSSESKVLDFLNGPDFEDDPADEVTVFKGTELVVVTQHKYTLKEGGK